MERSLQHSQGAHPAAALLLVKRTAGELDIEVWLLHNIELEFRCTRADIVVRLMFDSYSLLQGARLATVGAVLLG